MSRPGHVDHRLQRGHTDGTGAESRAADGEVAVLVRRHLIGPVLLWSTAPAGACLAAAACHHAPGVGLVVSASLAGSLGAAAAAVHGARRIAAALSRRPADPQKLEDTATALVEQRFAEFWQQNAGALQGTVNALQTTLAGITQSHQALHNQGASQEREFRNLTAAWLTHYRREIDSLLDAVKTMLAGIRQGKVPQRPAFPALPDQTGSPFAAMDADLVLLRHHVLDAVAQAGATSTDGAELDVFANIAQRLRSRADGVLVVLDGLERSTEDPDAMHALLRVDHRVVQMRRDVESVQVLAGGQLRPTGGPAEVATILRQATAEIEDYRRVDLGQVAGVQVVGYARSALIHILAALLENGCRFSRDQVRLASELNASGLVITVTDHGLHMMPDDLRTTNALLADPDPVMVRARLIETRIGLLVTAKLAAHYGMEVTLQPGKERGTQAVVVVPHKLLIHPQQQPDVPPAPAAADATPVPRARHAAVTKPGAPDAATPAVANTSTLHQGSALPRRTRTAPAASPPDGDRRPELPRRTPVPAAGASQAAPAPAPETAGATPGLAGAFIEGTSRAAGTDTPPDPSA